MVEIFFDGSCVPNPGRMGVGALVVEDDCIVARDSHAAGFGTSNIAEYLALISGLGLALDLGRSEVVIKGDSRLVILTVQGIWKTRHPGLIPLKEQAKGLLAKFSFYSFVWIPREENIVADELSTSCF